MQPKNYELQSVYLVVLRSSHKTKRVTFKRYPSDIRDFFVRYTSVPIRFVFKPHSTRYISFPYSPWAVPND